MNNKRWKRIRPQIAAGQMDCQWPNCKCQAKVDCPAPTGDGYVNADYGDVQRALAGMEESRPSGTADTASNVTTLPNGYPMTVSQKPQSAASKASATQSEWWKHYGKKAVCTHPGLKQVVRINESDIYIGAMSDLAGFHNIDLLVQCAMDTYGASRHTAQEDAVFPDGFEDLRQYVYGGPKEVIKLPWPDGGLPPVRPEFWGALEKKLPKGKVVFACVGGHGRSGTALAAMIVQHFKTTAKYAIDLVRQSHCEEAVETHGQERYLTYFAKWLADKEGYKLGAGDGPGGEDLTPYSQNGFVPTAEKE